MEAQFVLERVAYEWDSCASDLLELGQQGFDVVVENVWYEDEDQCFLAKSTELQALGINVEDFPELVKAITDYMHEFDDRVHEFTFEWTGEERMYVVTRGEQSFIMEFQP